MGEHAGEPLPRFHLSAGHQFLDFLSHVVEGFLQGPFAEQQSLCGEMEGKVAMTYGITHQPRPVSEQALMSANRHENRRSEGSRSDKSSNNHGRYFLYKV